MKNDKPTEEHSRVPVNLNGGVAKGLSRQSIFSATSTLFIGSVLSKVFGFFRDVLTARLFGASASMDAFLVAQTIPSIIGGALGAGLATAFVPEYIHTVSERGEETGKRLIRSVTVFALLLSLLLALAICISAPVIVRSLAPKFSMDIREDSIFMTRVLSFVLIGLVLYNLFSSFYHARNHFVIPSFSQLAENVIVLSILLVLGTSIGINALVISYFLGIYGIVAALFFSFPRAGGRSIRGIIDFRMITGIFRKVVPLLIGYLIYQGYFIIERYFASSLAEGSIASLSYARRLIDLPLVLLVTSITSAAFPTMSNFISQGKQSEMRILVDKLYCKIIFLMVPLTGLLISLRENIVSIVYKGGAFSTNAVNMTSDALLYYSIGLMPIAGEALLSKAFYAKKDMITPILVRVVGIMINIFANIVLVKRYGIAGVALSTSVMYISTWILLHFAYDFRITRMEIRNVAKVFMGSILCASFAVIAIEQISGKGIVVLAEKGFVFLLLYIISSFVFLKGELMDTLDSIRRIKFKIKAHTGTSN